MINSEILALINSIEVVEYSASGEEIEYISVADNKTNREILYKIGMTDKQIFDECFPEEESDGYLDLINVGFKYANWFEDGKGFCIKVMEVPFDEKLQFNCVECCENCQELECPNNLTRCQ